ncbi:MAG: hypothetical protein ACERJ2_19190 [Filomicrobium sp.]
MLNGYLSPHQSSDDPVEGSRDVERTACDASVPVDHHGGRVAADVGKQLSPQIADWMRRKKRNRRVGVMLNTGSWAISFAVTSAIIAVTVWLLPDRPAVLELWHEQAQRTLDAMEPRQTIELTAGEQITVPTPKMVY